MDEHQSIVFTPPETGGAPTMDVSIERRIWRSIVLACVAIAAVIAVAGGATFVLVVNSVGVTELDTVLRFWLIGLPTLAAASILVAAAVLRRFISSRTEEAPAATALDQQLLLNTIAEKMCRAVKGTSCYINTFDTQSRRSLVLSEYVGPEASELEKVSDLGVTYDEMDNELLECLLANSLTVDHVDDPDLSEADRQTMQQFGAKSVLYIPLYAKEDVVGFAEVWESRQRREFTLEEMHICQAIGQGSAMTIENTRLLADSQRLSNELTTLFNVGTTLITTLDRQEILNTVCRETVSLLGATSAYISDWIDVGHSCQIIAEYYGPDASAKERVSDMGVVYDGMEYMADMLETGQPRAIIASDPNLSEEERRELEEYGGNSVLYLPLSSRGHNLGYVEVWDSGRERTFTSEERLLAQYLTNQAAIAIENAQLIDAMRETVQELNSAAAEILAASTQQASGVSQQSAAISQTTTTVDEVRTISEMSVERAQQVVDSSQRTVQISSSGRASLQRTIYDMRVVKRRVESIAENIVALSEQTVRIGEIVSSVNDIAAQSSMLALNASVEAARAGEQGRGFAVVAEEVRSLAEQARQATDQIRSILLDIHDGISAAVMTTEQGTRAVMEGVQAAAQSEQAIEQLAQAIEESAQTAAQVTAGGQQQSAGIEQISLAMQSINQATQQTLASARQTEKAAQDLNTLAQRLISVLEGYG